MDYLVTLTLWQAVHQTTKPNLLSVPYSLFIILKIMHMYIIIEFQVFTSTQLLTCNISLIFDTFWVDHELSWFSVKKIKNKQTLKHDYNLLKNTLDHNGCMYLVPE